MVKKAEKTAAESFAAVPPCKKKYKGVRMRSWGSWVSEIRAPNQKTRIWLGSYSTAEAAARAYDAALLCLKGASASLNFPEYANSIPISDHRHFPRHHHIHSSDAAIMSPKSIQRVAAAAANGYTENVPAVVTPPSSAVSSPSLSSTPSEQPDDDVSVVVSSDGFYDQIDHPMVEMESWCNYYDALQSPKYVDQMLTGALFDFDFDFDSMPEAEIEDYYEEESDIRLWSFC